MPRGLIGRVDRWLPVRSRPKYNAKFYRKNNLEFEEWYSKPKAIQEKSHKTTCTVKCYWILLAITLSTLLGTERREWDGTGVTSYRWWQRLIDVNDVVAIATPLLLETQRDVGLATEWMW